MKRFVFQCNKVVNEMDDLPVKLSWKVGQFKWRCLFLFILTFIFCFANLSHIKCAVPIKINENSVSKVRVIFNHVSKKMVRCQFIILLILLI